MSMIRDHRPRPYTIIEDILFECDLSSLQKLTLASLQRYAGTDTSAYPGVKTLARCTSSSVRQVQRVLTELQELNLLRIERRTGQVSIYHIPRLEISGHTLHSVWGKEATQKTPDTMSPLPCHHVMGGMTPCREGGDMVSPKESHLRVSIKNSLSDQENLSPSPTVENPKQKNLENERKDPDPELIKAWNAHFSTSHQPANAREVKAMDWMLFAVRNQAIADIKSPVGYLKTICRNGHPTDFPEFTERKSKQTLPAYLVPPASEKWKLINPTHRQLFLMDAKDQGIPEPQLEKFAYQLFKKEYQREQNQLR